MRAARATANKNKSFPEQTSSQKQQSECLESEIQITVNNIRAWLRESAHGRVITPGADAFPSIPAAAPVVAAVA